jgi:hypothetical protein
MAATSSPSHAETHHGKSLPGCGHALVLPRLGSVRALDPADLSDNDVEPGLAFGGQLELA